MKKILLLFFSILFIHSAFAQGPIELRNTIWGSKYYVLGQQISSKQVESMLLSEPESAEYARKAKGFLIVGGVVGLAGVVMMTVAIFDDPFGSSSTLFWTGFAVSIASAPFTGIGLANFNKALDSHNSKYLDYNRPTSQLLLGRTSSGVGLMYRF